MSSQPYPGNPSLSPEARQRVLATFGHTLKAFREGKSADVSVGCDFVLKLDPLFEPARMLLAKAKDPSASIDVASLEAMVGGTAGAGAAGSPPGIAEARALFARREFPRAAEVAGQIAAREPGNREAAELAATAQERIEAAPFIAQFLRTAQQAVAEGDRDRASKLLEKARALDESNPGVEQLAATIAAAGEASPVDVGGFSFETSAGDDAAFSWDEPSPAEIPAPAAFDLETEIAPPPPEPFSLAEPAAFGFEASFESSADSPVAERGDPQRDKIASLLREGDDAFAASDYQKAIDLWSRIFLIDVTNSEATERIERAKQAGEERFREADAMYHQAVRLNEEKGDVTGARELLEKLVRAYPTHQPARDYLEAMYSVRATGKAPASATSNRPKELTLPPKDLSDDIFAEEMSAPMPSGSDSDILVPPDFDDAGMEGPEVGMPAATARRVQSELERTTSRRPRPGKFLVIGAVALVAVLVAGGWLFFKRDTLFSNSGGESSPSPAPSTAQSLQILQHARTLAGRGKVEEAIAELSKVPPEDPQHAKALAMIDELRRSSVPASPGAGGSSKSLSAEEATKLVERARQAYADKRFLETVENLNRAGKVLELGDTEKQMLAAAQEQLGKMQAALKYFNEGQYPEAQRLLWRLREEDGQNKDVLQYLVATYYDQAVLALRNYDTKGAAEGFRQALELAPDDPALQRHKRFADGYVARAPDLLYSIYVKNLPMR